MICDNISVKNGHLHFAGRDTLELAEKYGTPLYLMDEQRLRYNMRVYKKAMDAHFASALTLFASKAMATKRIYEIAKEEGLGVDVVSLGELSIAKAADFPMDKVYFHGNAKTDEDIRVSMDWGLGYFIVDNMDELMAVDRIAAEKGIVQNILIRVTPGIDPHTFEAVNTGKIDSKFGVPIETGQAFEFIKAALKLEHVSLHGLHAHVGSQVFDSLVFYDMANILFDFMAELKTKLGYETDVLNLGGGYGVRYVDTDPYVDIAYEISTVAEHVQKLCGEYQMKEPVILMEPGRSIVADAGMTLYTVLSTKTIPGYLSYVAVDGGMSDNPRYALYKSDYTVYNAGAMDKDFDREYTVVGRCCESDDMIQEKVSLPECKRGDIIAVCTTGAYNHSMSSNYNAALRPPVVMLDGEREYVTIRRETVADLLAREL